MLKKHTAILLLCVSNFLLVGHSIIPHEHFESISYGDEHPHHFHDEFHGHHHKSDQSNGQENREEKKNNLSDLFSFVSHTAEYLKSEDQTQNIECSVQHDDTTIGVFVFNGVFNVNISKLENRASYYRDPDYCPPNNSHKGLRAPPLFFS